MKEINNNQVVENIEPGITEAEMIDSLAQTLVAIAKGLFEAPSG